MSTGGVSSYQSVEPASQGQISQSTRSKIIFNCCLVAIQILGIVSIIIMVVWLGHYNGGFAWQEDPTKQFNYHPLFMMIGMIILYGDALLVYRTFRQTKKLYVKLIHAGILMGALVFAAVGLKAVFDSHNLANPPKSNLYSLHSWMGIITVAVFGMQWLLGALVFLLPASPNECRKTFKPLHVFFGLFIFFLAVATALMGINEKSGFSPDYSKRTTTGVLGNCLGLILIVFAILVGWAVTNNDYSRPADDKQEPEIQQLQ